MSRLYKYFRATQNFKKELVAVSVRAEIKGILLQERGVVSRKGRPAAGPGLAPTYSGFLTWKQTMAVAPGDGVGECPPAQRTPKEFWIQVRDKLGTTCGVLPRLQAPKTFLWFSLDSPCDCREQACSNSRHHIQAEPLFSKSSFLFRLIGKWAVSAWATFSS